jgi:glycolate oxidase
MALTMPEPDRAVLDRRDSIVAALRAIVPGEGVIAAEREMRPYESDRLTAIGRSMVVVLPRPPRKSPCAQFCHERHQGGAARGGTSLSGRRATARRRRPRHKFNRIAKSISTTAWWWRSRA